MTIASSSPSPPFRTGWKRGEKRAAERITDDYLDEALAAFSGYIAADELYDGPYCVLSIVDHHRFQRHRTAAEQKTLQRITRGRPDLRALRPIVEEVYRLFERRCRTDTAWAKLARLRRRVGRGKSLRQSLRKRFSPNLPKALTFLDDSLLPATSNAVECGNRRHRKMQKTIYRVRTGSHIRRRIALDMLREAQAQGRFQTTHTLHHARAGQVCSRQQCYSV